VWRKTLISNTHLHATVADKALKKLISQQLIKIVKDVMRPTRKIYMLYDLEPSQDITGGPWYTDNEFDVPFIETHANAILQYIRDLVSPSHCGQLFIGLPLLCQSFPKPRKDCTDMLYPTSNTKHYPSLRHITNWLKGTQLSDTVLEEEHVRTLLDMLVYGGEIEAMPSMRAREGDSDADSDTDGSNSDPTSDTIDDEGERDASSSRKRKGKGRSHSSRPRKKSRTEDDSEFSEDDDRTNSSSRSKKSKRRPHSTSSDESESDDGPRSRRSRRERSSRRSSDGSDSDGNRKRRRASKSKKNRHQSRSPSPGGAAMDMSFAEVEETAGAGASHGIKGSGLSEQPPRNMTLSQMSGDRIIYRALRRETSVVSGWSQAPCGHCPRFDFCDDSGPINPVSCQYYDTWLEPLETMAEGPSTAIQSNGDEAQADTANLGVELEV
jgi:DNA-directed RNA polymerase III subunit RPC6